MADDSASNASSEDEIALPSDSVPAALDKTATDQEHDIKFMVEKARTAALANNYFKAESLLKRVVKLTSRLHGPNHLDLAAHLSKLAAIQEQFNKPLESKLNWNRALYIFEMNRAAEDYTNKDRNRIRKEAQALEEPINTEDTKFNKPTNIQNDEPPPTISMFRPKKQLIPLQKLFKIPHFSMQAADASIINTKPIYLEDLTPRTRKAIKNRKVDPNHLRIRDCHSFYSANPKMKLNKRRQLFVKWAKRREWLYKELLEDRYVIQLTIDSSDRLDLMAKRFNEMKARRKAKIFGLDKGSNFDSSGVTRSILPPPTWDFKFKGSVAAAIDASKKKHFYFVLFIETSPPSQSSNSACMYVVLCAYCIVLCAYCVVCVCVCVCVVVLCAYCCLYILIITRKNTTFNTIDENKTKTSRFMCVSISIYFISRK